MAGLRDVVADYGIGNHDLKIKDMNAESLVKVLGLSPSEASNMLAHHAVNLKNSLIAEKRASTRYTTAVDGVLGRDEYSVSPDGTIFYRFDYGSEVAAYAMELAHTEYGVIGARHGDPKLPHYKDAFFIAANGFAIQPESYEDIPFGSTIVLGNTNPSSRKLDVGKIGTRRIRVEVPSGFMERIAAGVNRRWGRFVRAQRVWDVKWTSIQGIERHIINSPGKKGSRKPVQSPGVEIIPKAG